MTRSKADEHGAHELELFIHHSSEPLYLAMRRTMGNLGQFKAKGTYSRSGAEKAMLYVVDDAAKRYAKEFGGKWTDFSPATRKLAAKALAEFFEMQWASPPDRERIIEDIPTKKWREYAMDLHKAFRRGEKHKAGDNPWYGEPERHSEAAEKGWDGLTSTRAGRAKYPGAAALSSARKKASRKKPARKKAASKKTSRKSPARKKPARKKPARKKAGRTEMTPKERELKRRMGKLIGRK